MLYKYDRYTSTWKFRFGIRGSTYSEQIMYWSFRRILDKQSRRMQRDLPQLSTSAINFLQE